MDHLQSNLMINPVNYLTYRQYNPRFRMAETLFKERLDRAKNLYVKDMYAHYGCVNAIDFSNNNGEFLVSGGDDRRVLVWDLMAAWCQRSTPFVMQTNHASNIFCLAFDSTDTKIYSGGNDDQVIMHDVPTGKYIVKMYHKKPVYGLSVHPRNDWIVVTAGDDGKVILFDNRSSTDSVLCLAKQKSGFHSVMFNPQRNHLIATANADDGIALWDTRRPKQKLIHYDSDHRNGKYDSNTRGKPVSGISATFNSSGAQLLALRRRLPPVLYETDRVDSICQFYHPLYYNSCTMKTCSFAGDNDEYALSGSDDFNLYMWKIPPPDCDVEWGDCHMVLRGHRSIVNQVRYNKDQHLIASSGVEKIVKLWSVMPMPNWRGHLIRTEDDEEEEAFGNDDGANRRYIYSHDDYTHLVEHHGQRISHDYSDHSTEEDYRMLAFFDALIQREIEGWPSSSESQGTDDDNAINSTSSDTDSSTSSKKENSEDDDEAEDREDHSSESIIKVQNSNGRQHYHRRHRHHMRQKVNVAVVRRRRKRRPKTVTAAYGLRGLDNAETYQCTRKQLNRIEKLIVQKRRRLHSMAISRSKSRNNTKTSSNNSGCDTRCDLRTKEAAQSSSISSASPDSSLASSSRATSCRRCKKDVNRSNKTSKGRRPNSQQSRRRCRCTHDNDLPTNDYNNANENDGDDNKSNRSHSRHGAIDESCRQSSGTSIAPNSSIEDDYADKRKIETLSMSSLDVPSTSTGITERTRRRRPFRIVEPDSDDDQQLRRRHPQIQEADMDDDDDDDDEEEDLSLEMRLALVKGRVNNNNVSRKGGTNDWMKKRKNDDRSDSSGAGGSRRRRKASCGQQFVDGETVDRRQFDDRRCTSHHRQNNEDNQQETEDDDEDVEDLHRGERMEPKMEPSNGGRRHASGGYHQLGGNDTEDTSDGEATMNNQKGVPDDDEDTYDDDDQLEDAKKAKMNGFDARIQSHQQAAEVGGTIDCSSTNRKRRLVQQEEKELVGKKKRTLLVQQHDQEMQEVELEGAARDALLQQPHMMIITMNNEELILPLSRVDRADVSPPIMISMSSRQRCDHHHRGTRRIFMTPGPPAPYAFSTPLRTNASSQQHHWGQSPHLMEYNGTDSSSSSSTSLTCSSSSVVDTTAALTTSSGDASVIVIDSTPSTTGSSDSAFDSFPALQSSHSSASAAIRPTIYISDDDDDDERCVSESPRSSPLLNCRELLPR